MTAIIEHFAYPHDAGYHCLKVWGLEISEPHRANLTSYIATHALGNALAHELLQFSSSTFAPSTLASLLVATEQAGLPSYLTSLYRREESDTRFAMLASESLLVAEWSTPEEDEAWSHL